MSTVSPQGYQIENDPVNNNPFWEYDVDASGIKSIRCVKTTVEDFDYYNWSYVDKDDVSHHILTQEVSNKAGVDGVTFTPSVNSEGVISWTNNGGLPNPQSVSVKGPKGDKGDKGDTGAAGATGATGATGPRGPQGIQGIPGDNGVSPVVTTQAVEGGVRVTITDEEGTHSFILENGPTGPQGETGPAGPQGERGPQGEIGPAGPQGIQGETGPQGPTGPAGADGLGSVTVGTTTTGPEGSSASVTNSGTAQSAILNFTIPKGDTGATGAQGPTGPQGAQGPAGNDGVSPTITVTDHSTYHHVEIVDAVHTETFDIYDGAEGPTGPAGPTGATGPAGPGVPTGGTAGQVLAKVDSTDYNTQWVNAGGGSGGGSLKSTSVNLTGASGDTAIMASVDMTGKILKGFGLRCNSNVSISVKAGTSSIGTVILPRSQNKSECHLIDTQDYITEFNLPVYDSSGYNLGSMRVTVLWMASGSSYMLQISINNYGSIVYANSRNSYVVIDGTGGDIDTKTLALNGSASLILDVFYE